MLNNIFKLTLIFLLLTFLSGYAFAIPYEYSITGTASYWDINGDRVFSNESITGSFVLADFTTYQPADTVHHFFDILGMNISGESFALSGGDGPPDPIFDRDGSVHVKFYPSTYPPYDPGAGEPSLHLSMGGYTAYDTSGAAFWEYEPFFYDEFGNVDLSFSNNPYSISFSGSLYSNCCDSNDRYYINVNALRGAAVPEPSTLILIGSGLIGLIGVRYRIKDK